MAIKDNFIIGRPAEMGRIAIGMKSDKGYPQKLDHFIFTVNQADDRGLYAIDKVVTDIHSKELGASPKEIPVILSASTPDEVFYTSYARYVKPRVCDCYGDGVTALRNIGGEWTEVKCGYNECEYKVHKRQGKKDVIACKPRGILSVWLPLVNRIGGVFKFRTSSRNTIGNITSTLEQFYAMRGTLLGLTCKMVIYPKMMITDRNTGSTQKVYLVRLEYDGSLDEMIKSKGVFGQVVEPKALDVPAEEVIEGSIADESAQEEPTDMSPADGQEFINNEFYAAEGMEDVDDF